MTSAGDGSSEENKFISGEMEENVTLTAFNTVYEGRCYTWSMPGIKVSNKDRVLKDIYVNLANNNSNCIAYIHPAAPSLLAAVNRWPFPIEPLRVRNSRFIETKIALIVHTDQMGDNEDGGSQCDNSASYSYFEVSDIMYAFLNLHCLLNFCLTGPHQIILKCF